MSRPRARSSWVVVVGAFVLLASSGCWVFEDGQPVRRGRAAARPTFSPLSSPAPSGGSADRPPDVAAIDVRVTRLFTVDGEPTVLAARPGDDARYLGTKDGRIRAVRDGRLASDPVLDLTAQVESSGNEQGLVGADFSPDGQTLYVNFTARGGDTRVQAFPFGDEDLEADDGIDILRVEQPYPDHNGGGTLFGPDGRLWIALGDGGNREEARRNAQRLDLLLGKILRIEPTPEGESPYTVPETNPFVGRPGRDEIWSYGLRNPFRFSFDRATGDLWIGDVGSAGVEEVDLETAPLRGGWNYGWPLFEGFHELEDGTLQMHTPPVFEYGRPPGFGRCAVTGGYVYRGSRIPALRGAYVFADHCAGRIQMLTISDGRVLGHRFLDTRRVPTVTSFGEGLDGELYVVQRSGEVSRIDPEEGGEVPSSPLSPPSGPR